MRQAIRLIPLLLLAWAPAAEAYVGPGVGLGAIALVAGMIGSLGLWFVAILWYPFRRMLHRRRQAMKGTTDPSDALPATGTQAAQD